MKYRFVFLILLSSLFLNKALSNNLQVSNVALTGFNSVSNFALIQFDVSWDNSWRTSAGPSNYDAVWLFAKYRLKTSDVWNHATLHYVDGTGSGDGHTEPAGTNIASADDNGSGGAYGAFIYATADFAQASVNYTTAELRWDYGVDGLSSSDSVEICLFGIEMIYIPQASFYVGDGNLTVHGQFRIQASNSPFQITSEASLTLGGGGAGDLHNNNASGMNTADDFNDATSQTLPAAFPKGYDAYYCMKYEVSQEQYVGFLNKLTRTQQTARIAANTVGEFMHSSSTRTTPANRNGVKLMTDPGGLTPRVYGNDLDDDDTFDEADDGQNIACNWMSSGDLLAYLDWSGLRPMTELEYEKSCRGTLSGVAGEYAWGTTTILGATGITNSGAVNEIASNAGSNCVYNNAGAVQGPMRVGNFAQAATTRVQAGAGYYGIMELSGNVWEDVVLVGCVAGRAFTGLHGDGELNTNGEGNVDYWPGINGNNATGTANGTYAGVTGCTGYAGISFTGGTWNNSAWLTTSDRSYRGTGWNGISGRDRRNGGRGVRIAP